MELIEAMKSVGTCRRFADEAVSDEVLWKAIEAARFGPQGGNRQPVRFLVVRDGESKARLAELYMQHWEGYAASARERARRSGQRAMGSVQAADEFAKAFAEHPAIVVVCAHLPDLLATDVELGRLSIVGGASVYPIVQNFLLALRDLGVASAMTTLLCRSEREVKALLGIPENWATACHIAVGYPVRPFPTALKRLPVDQIVFGERFGQPLGGGGEPS